jgi:hypothetical protein
MADNTMQHQTVIDAKPSEALRALGDFAEQYAGKLTEGLTDTELRTYRGIAYLAHITAARIERALVSELASRGIVLVRADIVASKES